MRTLLALLTLASAGLAAPVPKEIKETPREKLQGEWVIVSLDSGAGQQEQTGDFASFTLAIKGDKLTTNTSSGQGYKNETVVYDFAASPMRIDVHTGTSVTPGIFKFEDGKLYWCHAQQNAARPTEFKGGDGRHCTIWKRAVK